MKKIIVLMMFALISFAGVSRAATTSFTETLPAVQPLGSVPVSNGYSWSLSSNAQGSAPMLTLPVGTLTYFSTLQAQTTGQIGFCTNCATANGGLGMLCISTGSTTTNQFIGVSSATAVTACK